MYTSTSKSQDGHLLYLVYLLTVLGSLPQDILEYVNMVCSGFLASLSLVIQSCYDMFVKRHQAR